MLRTCSLAAFWLALPASFSLARGQQTEVVACNLLRSIELQQSGRDAVEHKQYATAGSAFRQAFDACPTEHKALLALAEANNDRREFPLAIQEAQHFLLLEPDAISGRLVLANSYFMAQRLPEALEQAEDVLKREPAQPTALKLKGSIEYLSGRFDSALNSFLVLLDRYPQDSEGAHMLGRIYYQEGRIDYAIGQFQRVLKIDPPSYKAYDNLG
jgi:tetratricopeptide (TPR) repeat protein